MADLIERADATETFAELYDVFDDYPNIIKELHKTYDKILAIPSADKQGKWINAGILTVRCSNCKSEFHELEAMNFCPKCGADMQEGIDDETD